MQDSNKTLYTNKTNNHSPQLSELKEDTQSNKLIDTKALGKEAGHRSKKLPFIQKVQKKLSKDTKPFSELLFNSGAIEKRMVSLRDGVLDKFNIERKGDRHEVGAIFRGKIQNLEPGLKAAFVDIGQEKNAFLHYWDILPTSNDNSIEVVKNNKSKKQLRQEKISLKNIPDLYPIGSEILVQITKGQIGNKGPRTTTNISLPGRFLVLTPFGGTLGISRKIEDKGERTRLKKILRNMTLPEGMGLIIRTAGEGKKLRYFVRDLEILKKRWQGISDRIKRSKLPSCVYVEPDLIGRTVRDFLTEDVDRIVVDNKEAHELILSEVDKISPRSKSKVFHYKDEKPIFDQYKVEEQLNQIYQRNVPLPSGGEIVIEETEALISIDVNTGSHRNSEKDGKNFILAVNLEAAKEIARQIRLRNIGGLIIVDFIDMKAKKDRDSVFRKMKREVENDRAKTHLLPISNFGIMQMTRQRHSESHASNLFSGCPYCESRGKIKSIRTVTIDLQRRVLQNLKEIRSREGIEEEIHLKVTLHPSCLSQVKEDAQVLLDIERNYGARLSFATNPAFHIESFEIIQIKD
ncbi:MAG: ribonuclease E/G [Puniceicoccaceae bacterium MED-G32]|jgi:ribonuclease G|nr:MAG: ribonuclease E/G [Puniceicoccaceae bacterium MED-G32]|tara:strand:- start:2485 stop:4209 length:1725 start_codon:yes stop_codon:yes gene_type:complete